MLDNLGSLVNKTKALVKSLRDEASRLKSQQKALGKNTRTTPVAAGQVDVVRVDVSTSSVVKATLTIIGLLLLVYLIYQIKSILVLFFFAAFLALALDPFVDKLQKWRIPRGLGIILIYLIFVGVLGFVIASFIPILANEIPKLATSILEWVSKYGVDTSTFQAEIARFQNYLANIQQHLNRENLAAGLDVLNTVGKNALAIVISVAGGIFNFIMVLVITFFMIVEEDGIRRFLLSLFPVRFHPYIEDKMHAVESKFGSWVRGQVILMIAVGLLVYILLRIFGLNYAVTLATIAGFTELIPYVGPIVGSIPALIVALSQGGIWMALIVLLIYVGVQQLEGNIIVPLVMKRAVGLSPIIVILAMLVGTSFPETINPVIGIIISVPLATALSIFVRDYADKKK